MKVQPACELHRRDVSGDPGPPSALRLQRVGILRLASRHARPLVARLVKGLQVTATIVQATKK